MRAAALALLALSATANAELNGFGQLKQQGELDDIWAYKNKVTNVTFSFYFTCGSLDACADATPSGNTGRKLFSQKKLQKALNDAVNTELGKAAAAAKKEFREQSPHNQDEFEAYADAVFKTRDVGYLVIDRLVQTTAGANDNDRVYVKTNDDIDANGERTTKYTNNPDYWQGFVRATAVNVTNLDLWFASQVLAQPGDQSAAVTFEKRRFADHQFGGVIDTFENAGTYTVKESSVWISTEAELITDQLEPVPGRGKRDSKYLLPLLLGVSAMLLVPIIATLVLVTLKKASRKEENWVATLDKHVDLMTTRNNAKQSEIDALKTSEEHLHKGIKKREQDIADRRAYDLLQDEEVDWADGTAPPPPPPKPVARELPPPEPKENFDAEAKLLWRIVHAHSLRKKHLVDQKAWLAAENARRDTLMNAPSGSLGLGVNQDMTVKAVRKNSAADKAGLKLGDLIIGTSIKGRGGLAYEYPIAKPSNLSSVIGPKYGVYEGTEIDIIYIRNEADKKEFMEKREKLGDLGDDIDDKEAQQFFHCSERDGTQFTQHLQLTMGAETEKTLSTRRKNMEMNKEDTAKTNPAIAGMDIDILMTFMAEPKKAQDFARKFFEEADADKSGSLGLDELTVVFNNILRDLCLEAVDEADAKRLFYLMDESNDGEVSFEEFFPYFRHDIVFRILNTIIVDE